MENINEYRWVGFTYLFGNYYITVKTLVACLIFPSRESRDTLPAGKVFRLKNEINK